MGLKREGKEIEFVSSQYSVAAARSVGILRADRPLLHRVRCPGTYCGPAPDGDLTGRGGLDEEGRMALHASGGTNPPGRYFAARS